MRPRKSATPAAWVLLLAGSPVLAANETWVEVGVATNNVRALVDTDTIAAANGRVEVQQRFVLPAGTTGRIAYVDQRVIYDCKSGRVQTLRSTEYDAGGSMLRDEGPRQNPVYKVLDGTLPRHILDVLC